MRKGDVVLLDSPMFVNKATEIVAQDATGGVIEVKTRFHNVITYPKMGKTTISLIDQLTLQCTSFRKRS